MKRPAQFIQHNSDTELELKNVLHMPSRLISKTNLKQKTQKFVGISVMTTGLLVGSLFMVNAFFMNHYFEFKSPIIFQSPITLHTREVALLSPITNDFVIHAQEVPPQPVKEVVSPNIEGMVKAIRQLESSNGTAKEGLAVYCKKKGMSNEYGFGGMQLMHCFKDNDEATLRVTRWIKEKIVQFDNDEVRTMCYYNLGKDVKTCEYGNNYLSMKN